MNLSNESGATPLLLASKYGYILVVQVRLDCTSKESGVNPILQFVNVHGNNSFQLKHVLHSSYHHFPHILTLALFHSIDRGVTPSSLTSQALLAITNIDVNLSDDSGGTPLLFASEEGHLRVVQVKKRRREQVHRAQPCLTI